MKLTKSEIEEARKLSAEGKDIPISWKLALCDMALDDLATVSQESVNRLAEIHGRSKVLTGDASLLRERLQRINDLSAPTASPFCMDCGSDNIGHVTQEDREAAARNKPKIMEAIKALKHKL